MGVGRSCKPSDKGLSVSPPPPFLTNTAHKTRNMDNNDKGRISFSVGIAKKAGINAAIVHEKLVYYISENYKKKQLFQVTISAEKLAERIPILNRRQIQYAMDKLQEHGLITTSDWRNHTTGTQKTYTIEPQIIEQYYDENRYKFVTVDRDKIVTDRTKIVNDRTKIVTPPLQNCHGSICNTMEHIEEEIEEKIEEEIEEKTLPEIFDFRNPLCSQFKRILPNSYITQEDYNTILGFVKEFGLDTTIEYIQDTRKDYPKCYANAEILDKTDTQLTLLRHDLRRKARGW